MSKKMRLYFAVVMSAVILVFAYWNFGRATRSVVDFNSDWEFHLGDIKDGEMGDLQFQKVALPHEFSGSDVGVYRKEFDVPSSWEGKLVVVDFAKSSGKIDFWINGAKANAIFSKSGFEVDITPYLRYGEVNAVAMRVGKDAVVMASTGIEGNANIIVKNKVSIARNGVDVSVAKGTDNLAKVAIRTRIANKLTSREIINVFFEIKDANGKTVAEKELKTGIDGGALAMLSLELKIDLAQAVEPKPYTLQVSIAKGHSVLDEVVQSFEIK